jgi:hypothetical protein
VTIKQFEETSSAIIAKAQAIMDQKRPPTYQLITSARDKIGALPSDIPGLWFVPGYPELTTAQMLQIASKVPAQ